MERINNLNNKLTANIEVNNTLSVTDNRTGKILPPLTPLLTQYLRKNL